MDTRHSFENYATHFDKVTNEMADQAYGKAPIIKRQDNPAEAELFKDEDW